jgi:hypothetical protein
MLALFDKSDGKTSDDDMDIQDEKNVKSLPGISTPSQSHNLKNCKVFLNNLDYQSLINKIDKRLEPIISGSELPFTVISCLLLLRKHFK